jgi:hypothetical protein
MKRVLLIRLAIVVLLILSLACNLATQFTSASSPPSAAAPSSPPPAAPSSAPVQAGSAIPAAAGSATPPPLVATIMASHHVMTPANVVPAGTINYDVDSSVTASEHRAPYGDSYNINLFERPFTKTAMDYLPELDITTFSLSQDNDWSYVSFDLSGGDLNDKLGVNYGVELDTDHDGFGDVLVWASPPYTPDWLAETVQVYKDSNHDTGGLSAEKSDAVFSGNGYDTIIFDRGQGTDTDLAWVRLNPQTSSAIQFAFKRSLAGSAFMWGVWADAGLRNPAAFNYNDRFTEADAGSPQKSEKYYPINAINQVDNTCWQFIGFKPTGEEPHLCPVEAPPKVKHKPQPTPQGCTPWWTCIIVRPLPQPQPIP